MYKCNASHLLFSLYQSNASHFLFSLDYCNARLLLFSLVQDCVMATTSCFHYNKTVWCQLPLILVYRIAFECSPYSFQKNIHRDAKDLQYLSFSKKIKKKKKWETPLLTILLPEEWQRSYTIYREAGESVKLLWSMVKF